jgi:hypothetical protein
MAINDRVQIDSGDISFGQLAPSQALRTSFTPGKISSRPGDTNWPKDYRIPTGTPAFDGESAGPVEMKRTRIIKVGRNIVCDQTVLAPVVTGTRVETVVSSGIWGASTVADTINPSNLANQERQAGSDTVKGA